MQRDVGGEVVRILMWRDAKEWLREMGGVGLSGEGDLEGWLGSPPTKCVPGLDRHLSREITSALVGEEGGGGWSN